MFKAEDTRDPTAVAHEVQCIYVELFPDADPVFVPRIVGGVIDCFCGGNPNFLPIDALYHDLEHTLQGTLCLARLLRGRHLAGVEPRLGRRMFELGLLAILLHDTGYLKRVGDTQGTGAKYTPIHVRRSADFAGECLAPKGFPAADIRAVQNMIQCTGIAAHPQDLPFQNELERIIGCALGTADLLGQMAAPDYVDKLPILYQEFEEAAAFDGGKSPALTTFQSPEELVSKTPEFWDNYVRPRIDGVFGGLYRYLANPYPDGPNPYLERIEANIARIRRERAS
ncbi:MAG: hypothetical protein H7A47_10455 [Verrucomicrobiales bacterium]|nr:hypothetical protein [Verrucomicrobiales bacterium]